jgi:hypothetical protein
MRVPRNTLDSLESFYELFCPVTTDRKAPRGCAREWLPAASVLHGLGVAKFTQIRFGDGE